MVSFGLLVFPNRRFPVQYSKVYWLLLCALHLLKLGCPVTSQILIVPMRLFHSKKCFRNNHESLPYPSFASTLQYMGDEWPSSHWTLPIHTAFQCNPLYFIPHPWCKIVLGDKPGKESQRDLFLQIWAEKGAPSVWHPSTLWQGQFQLNMTSSLNNLASLVPPAAETQGCRTVLCRQWGRGLNQGVGRGRFVTESNVVAPVGLCTWSDLGGEMWTSELTGQGIR